MEVDDQLLDRFVKAYNKYVYKPGKKHLTLSESLLAWGELEASARAIVEAYGTDISNDDYATEDILDKLSKL